MSATPIARVRPVRGPRRFVTTGTRRSVALVVALGILAMPAAAYAAVTTEEPIGTDEDFCLDTPPGVPVNEFNCPVTTTTTTSTKTTRSESPTPRVRTQPRFTG